MTREQILEQLGIAKASQELKDSVLGDLNSILDLRFAGIVDELLTDEQKSSLNLLGDTEPEAVGQWLKDNVPRASELYEAILRDEIESFKNRL